MKLVSSVREINNSPVIMGSLLTLGGLMFSFLLFRENYGMISVFIIGATSYLWFNTRIWGMQQRVRGRRWVTNGRGSSWESIRFDIGKVKNLLSYMFLGTREFLGDISAFFAGSAMIYLIFLVIAPVRIMELTSLELVGCWLVSMVAGAGVTLFLALSVSYMVGYLLAGEVVVFAMLVPVFFGLMSNILASGMLLRREMRKWSFLVKSLLFLILALLFIEGITFINKG
jgi:hypothetical protein